MKLCLLLLGLLLSACASLPPEISDAPLYDLSYQEAVANIDKFKNAPVRWGGVIVDIANEQNRSLLQVLAYPLDSSGRPLIDELYQGRFVVTTPEFLDPAIYAKKSKITVAGTLLGTIDRTIDQKTLHLPLLSIKQTHLWLEYPLNNYGYGGMGIGYGSFYGYPTWGGFYRPMMFPPMRY